MVGTDGKAWAGWLALLEQLELLRPTSIAKDLSSQVVGRTESVAQKIAQMLRSIGYDG